MSTAVDVHYSGPRLFLSCPMDVADAQVWFTDLWNYSVVPYLIEAAKEGLQVSIPLSVYLNSYLKLFMNFFLKVFMMFEVLVRAVVNRASRHYSRDE